MRLNLLFLITPIFKYMNEYVYIYIFVNIIDSVKIIALATIKS